MGESADYREIKAMLKNGLLVVRYAQLVRTLEQFEKEGLISGPEREDLLELAERLQLDRFNNM